MASDADSYQSSYITFWLIVTGKGEEQFLPALFRSLRASGGCNFRVSRRIGQRNAITSKKRKLQMVGCGKTIPDRDAQEIGLPARMHLADESSFVVLVDDLESHDFQETYDRYRLILDTMLLAPQKRRASVHLLVRMLEAYYFADAAAINAVLETDLRDYDGDVEEIRHPKGELKKLFTGFDEIDHGKKIIARLDVPHIRSDPATCASLRTLFGWCCKALGRSQSNEYQLASGQYSAVTRPQIDSL